MPGPPGESPTTPAAPKSRAPDIWAALMHEIARYGPRRLATARKIADAARQASRH